MNKKNNVQINLKISRFAAVPFILFKSFIKSPRGFLFAYILPVGFLVMFKFIFESTAIIGDNPELNDLVKHVNLISYTLIPLTTMLILLSSSIIDWKNSVFLSRIESSGISKAMFILNLWIFYFIISITAVLFLFVVSLILGGSSYMDSLKQMNWSFIILGIILLSSTSIALATFIAGITSSEGLVQGLVMALFFISLFMGGLLLSPAMFERSDVTRYFTYFIPFKHSIYVFLYGAFQWQNGHIGLQDQNAVYNNGDNTRGLDYTQIWEPILISSLLIAVLFILNIKTFRWSATR